MNSYRPPVVPDELIPLLTPTVLEAHELWSRVSLNELDRLIPAPEIFSYGQHTASAVVSKGDPEAGIDVISSSHQQAWKPSTAIRTMFTHDATNKEGVTIALPNGSARDIYYLMSDDERAEVDAGNMIPFYEMQARTVEAVMKQRGFAGKISLKGYSLGGLSSLGIAAVGGDKLDIARVDSVETPTVDRTPKQLRKDFLASGTLKQQRAAIADANMPVLSEALRLDRLLLDYARFGVASVVNKDSKALNNGMANPVAEELLARVQRNSEGTIVNFGYVVGSLLFKQDSLGEAANRGSVNFYRYSGAGAHGHATGDNPVALSMMLNR